KAHQEIYNSLLQVLEDGRLTDGQGRTVDFKNTVLIFTSNLGTSDISKAVGLGFTQGGGDNNYERMKQKVNDELKKHFRPEFLNRIDDIIVFHQLTRDEIIRMVDLMIGRVEKQLKGKDMAMELTDKAKSLLAKRGFDPVLGARPLRRTIQREIEDALSEKILFEEVGPGRLVTVDVDNWDGEGSGEDVVFTFTGSKKPAESTEPELEKAGAGGAPTATASEEQLPRNGRLPSPGSRPFHVRRGALPVLVVTTNDLPGWEIQRVCGEVFGLTVRSRNAFSQIGAGFKSMFGGELQGMTKNLTDRRNEAMARLIAEARARGGNAIVAMRFDTTELGDVWTEICAYGTAVQAVPVTDAAKYTAQQLGYGAGG